MRDVSILMPPAGNDKRRIETEHSQTDQRQKHQHQAACYQCTLIILPN